MRLALICVCLVLGIYVPSTPAQTAVTEGAEANPGRPTVSTPATLTPAGYLQFETGALAANHSPEFSSRYGLNEVLKLSVVPRLELLASAEPIAHYTTDGIHGNKAAEVFLGAQAVLNPGEGSRPTIAASYFHKVYDGGAPELDFGSPSNSFVLLASADVKDFITTQTQFSTKWSRIGFAGRSLARHFPFPTTSSEILRCQEKSGTLTSPSSVAMR
jgi:hypothetical protein